MEITKEAKILKPRGKSESMETQDVNQNIDKTSRPWYVEIVNFFQLRHGSDPKEMLPLPYSDVSK